MAAKTVALPSKVECLVERGANLLPVGLRLVRDIRVGRHVGQGEDGFFIGNVGRQDRVHGPGRGIHDGHEALPPRLGDERVDDGRSAVAKSFYGVDAAAGLELGQGVSGKAILGGEEDVGVVVGDVALPMQAGMQVGAVVEDLSEAKDVLGRLRRLVLAGQDKAWR